jgi:PAS domain S-box-containing protein
MSVMDKTSKLRIEKSAVTNDYPGLLSFINSKGIWSYLSREWVSAIDASLLHDNIDKTQFIHPIDRSKYTSLLKESFEKKFEFTIDFRIRKNDGSYIFIRETGRPSRDIKGEFTGFSCIGIDVGDLISIKPEKDKLAFLVNTIMEYSADAVAIYDIETRLVKMNRKAEEILGINSADVAGKKFLEIFPSAESEKSYQDLLKAIEGDTIYNTHYDSKISKRTFENYLFPMKDENQNVYSVLGIAHDITDYIETTIELEKTYKTMEEKNRELERSNKELGSFTYVASHDMQEPLRKIQAFGKRIVEKETQNLSDSGKDYLSRMVEAAHRMQKLIDSLLEFSRTTTATKKFEVSDLNILIDEVKRDNRFSLEEKQAVIEVSPLPVISVVPFQFKQLVSNLISNSIKYSKTSESPRITITSDIIPSKQIDRAGKLNGINYCRIRFSDNGIGFDPVFSEQIFELFQRLHGRAEYSGSGIGLSICKKIVENHQGFITAEGKPDEGATFYVYLPMKH